MKITELILNHEIFKKDPIILMHIGSADSNFEIWNNIAKNSILISIDGNNSLVNTKNNFKKIINQQAIISNKNSISFFGGARY